MANKKHSPNGYVFECSGHTVISDGKVYWRDCLTISFDRLRALQIIQGLAAQLEDDKHTELSISMCGWLEQEEQGHWPFGEGGAV